MMVLLLCMAACGTPQARWFGVPLPMTDAECRVRMVEANIQGLLARCEEVRHAR